MTELSKRRISRILLVVCFGGIVCGLSLVYAEESPFWEAAGYRANAIRLVPQGWAFFTRDPRERVEYVYEQQQGEWVVDGRFYAGTRSWGDLLKRNRLIHVELAQVLSEVPDSSWKQCGKALSKCVKERTYERVTVDNETALQDFCGEYMVERRERIPWAWFESNERFHMPSKAVKIRVKCKSE